MVALPEFGSLLSDPGYALPEFSVKKNLRLVIIIARKVCPTNNKNSSLYKKIVEDF